MNNDLISCELTTESVKSMIYEVRGLKVMLDSDLAKIYGYETRYFNRQINNNIERFPERYRFQITKDELDSILKCKNFTSSWGGIRKLPYVFTEKGVYMAMTVLKGKLAVTHSLALIDAFTEMKNYIAESNNVGSSSEIIKIVNQVTENKMMIDKLQKDNEENKKKIEVLMDNFIDPSTYKHFVIFNGNKLDADIAYQDIYSKANESIIVIDDYIDIKTIQLLRNARNNVSITIITDNKAKNSLNANFIRDSGLNISFKKNNGMCHDRYILLDFGTEKEAIFHSGSSSKDSGSKLTAINQIEKVSVYKDIIGELLNNEDLIIK